MQLVSCCDGATRCDALQAKQNELREQTTQARNMMAQLQREAGQARQELATAERRAADFTARQTALTEKKGGSGRA
jgi:chromosome segregation ATPase